jgi:glycerate kinase
VTNPLIGPDGASAVYGPQKGAAPADVAHLDAALAHFADLVARHTGEDRRAEPGAGAAGGLGFALLAFLGARLERGVRLVLDAVDFDRHLQHATVVLTGEGRIDRQTVAFGKTLAGIGERARHAGVPVLALAGSLGSDLEGYRDAGLSGVASIVPRPMPLEEAMADAAHLVEDAACRMLEVFLAGRAAPA